MRASKVRSSFYSLPTGHLDIEWFARETIDFDEAVVLSRVIGERLFPVHWELTGVNVMRNFEVVGSDHFMFPS